MSEVKFTPAPWNIDSDFHLQEKDRYYQIVAGDRCISEENGFHGFSLTGIMSEADAKLIAAAPEMFQIIQSIYEWSNKNDVFGPIYPSIEAVYKKVIE